MLGGEVAGELFVRPFTPQRDTEHKGRNDIRKQYVSISISMEAIIDYPISFIFFICTPTTRFVIEI